MFKNTNRALPCVSPFGLNEKCEPINFHLASVGLATAFVGFANNVRANVNTEAFVLGALWGGISGSFSFPLKLRVVVLTHVTIGTLPSHTNVCSNYRRCDCVNTETKSLSSRLFLGWRSLSGPSWNLRPFGDNSGSAEKKKRFLKSKLCGKRKPIR